MQLTVFSMMLFAGLLVLAVIYGERIKEYVIDLIWPPVTEEADSLLEPLRQYKTTGRTAEQLGLDIYLLEATLKKAKDAKAKKGG